MASTTTENTATSTSQAAYQREFELSMSLVADPRTYNGQKDWFLGLDIQCDDLLKIMKEGLFWTTSNVVPEQGWLGPTPGPASEDHPFLRVWELRERPDRPESESTWIGTLTLYAESIKDLADFRLHDLQREHVMVCSATRTTGHRVFNYCPLPGGDNYNCFDDHLHPAYGSWWFWPMEVILDYRNLGDAEKE